MLAAQRPATVKDEVDMLELLKSLVFAVCMVPVMMALILGAIYGLGEVFNLFSAIGHRESSVARK